MLSSSWFTLDSFFFPGMNPLGIVEDIGTEHRIPARCFLRCVM